jgi:hypothetical protein
MLVRIRWTHMQGGTSHLQNVALATSALLTPAALIAFTICFWGMASELQWTSAFFISSGIFSHWQVWLVTAGILLLISRLLNRWAKF